MVEECHCFWADSLEMEQVEDGRWELLEEVTVVGDRAAVHQLGDLCREILADPGQAETVSRRQVGDALAGVSRSFRRRCDTRES